MQKIFIILLSAFFVYSNAQIGIKIANPVGALDINGDLNVRSSLRIGGTNTIMGNAGVAGTIFHNNADLPVNDWKEIKIADGQGSMSVFFINTATDQHGAIFTENGNSVPYTENSVITADWKVLEDTEYTFAVSNAVNKIVFTFQTTAQKMGNGNSSSGFACGIYLDNYLKAVRTDVILGPEGSYKIFNLNATLTNIPPKNDYKVKAACIKRALNGGTLGIGTPATDNNPYLNATMSQSVLTTSVLQSYQ